MASSMSFDIFARDHASRVFDKVGDNAERLGRRIDGAGKSTGGLQGGMDGLSRAASGLLGQLDNIGGRLASMTVSAISFAGKAALVAGALATLGASAASAAGYTVALAAAIAPLGGLLAALPGVALLGAAAFTTWKLATGGLGEAMSAALAGNAEKLAAAMDKLSDGGKAFVAEFQQVIPALKDFKAAAQDAFTGQLAGSLVGLVAALDGLKPAIAGLAAEFGQIVRQVLEFATSGESIGSFNTILGNTRALFAGLREALQPLLRGFLDLAAVGSTWLAGMSGGLTENLTKFGQWMSRVSESGQALAWMDDALVVLKQLGELAKDVWQIITGVLNAARDAGTGALGVLGAIVDKFNAWVNSAEGQDTLITIFRALSDVGKALMPVIESLAGAVALLAPHIADLAETIGPILKTAIDAVAPALEKLGPALVTVFTEFGKAVQTIADSGALKDLATAIADILVALAPLLPSLAQVLVPVLKLLSTLVSEVVAPALETLVGWIRQGVEWLQGGGLSEDSWLMRVIKTIVEVGGPIFEQFKELVGSVFTDLVAWFTENKATVEEWGNRIISIIQSAGEIIAGVFQAINIAWDLFGKPLLDLVGGVFSGILAVIDGVMQMIKGLINIALGVITGDWERVWGGIRDFLGGLWEVIKGIVSTALSILKFQVTSVLGSVGETWDSAWNKIKQVTETAWNAITGWIDARVSDIRNFIGRLAELPGQVGAWFGQVKDSIVNKFNEAVTFVQSIPGRFRDALSNLGSILYDSGQRMIQGLIDGISSMIGNAVGTVTNLLNEIRARLPFSPAKEGPFSGKGWTLFSGQSMGRDLAKGIAMSESLVARAADGLMGAASVSLSPSVSGAGGAGMIPIAPRGGDLHLHLSGSALMSRDELSRLLIAALNEAKGRGFSLGAVGAA